MSAKSEFNYIKAHFGRVCVREGDEDQEKLIKLGIAYLNGSMVVLKNFHGVQTFKNALIKARERELKCEEDEYD